MSDNQRAQLAAGEHKMLMNVEEEMEEQEGVNMMIVMMPSIDGSETGV